MPATCPIERSDTDIHSHLRDQRHDVDLDGAQDWGAAVRQLTASALAGRILIQACSSEVQAMALVDSWINALVRQRARAAALRLDLGLVQGLGVLCGFGFGLGLALDPGGVVAGGLPFGLLLRHALGGLIGLC